MELFFFLAEKVLGVEIRDSLPDEGAQALDELVFDLADPLLAHPVPVADLLEGQGIVREHALFEDLLFVVGGPFTKLADLALQHLLDFQLGQSAPGRVDFVRVRLVPDKARPWPNRSWASPA